MSIREPQHLEHLAGIVSVNHEAYVRYCRFDVVIANDAFVLVLTGG